MYYINFRDDWDISDFMDNYCSPSKNNITFSPRKNYAREKFIDHLWHLLRKHRQTFSSSAYVQVWIDDKKFWLIEIKRDGIEVLNLSAISEEERYIFLPFTEIVDFRLDIYYPKWPG